MAAKKQTSIRLSDEGYAIRDALSAKLGIDGTAVVEMALRKLADAEGIVTKHPFRQTAMQVMHSVSRKAKDKR